MRGVMGEIRFMGLHDAAECDEDKDKEIVA